MGSVTQFGSNLIKIMVHFVNLRDTVEDNLDSNKFDEILTNTLFFELGMDVQTLNHSIN